MYLSVSMLVKATYSDHSKVLISSSIVHCLSTISKRPFALEAKRNMA